MQNNNILNIGIIGLGLIGGSLCKAYRRHESFVLYVRDRNPVVEDFAVLSGCANAALDDENLKTLDLLFLCTYPKAAAEILASLAPQIAPHTIVIDCLGVKREICETGFALARQYGFTFVGGHPMAGTQYAGFKNAREDLFDGAPMVIVPPADHTNDIVFLEKLKGYLRPAGFGSIAVSTAQEHDARIAFTSQLAHVVSNAYVKSPTARYHKGVSAGSYRDLTRVAWLSPEMWAELFLDNKDNLLFELDTLQAHLREYRDAIAQDDRETLERLLDDGRRLKQEIDG